MTDDLRATLDATQRALLGEIPPEQAENDGWPQQAMPAILGALGLTDAPEFRWFVSARSAVYDKAEPDGWRYCHAADHPQGPDLLGIAYSGPPPRVYLRADMNLPQTIRTLGHELYHVREFARGEPTDEEAADEFGDLAAARFLTTLYHP